MNAPSARRGRRAPWETSLLGWLAYPANLAFAGIAASVLALPLVTALSAAIAVGVALDRWRDGDETGVFTGTFRAWRETWRRSLGLSVVSTLLGALLVTNWVFLLTRQSPLALVMLGALVPVTVVALLLIVHLPAAVTADPDGVARDWVRRSFALSFARPFGSLAVVVVVVTWGVFLLLLPTVIPFFAISVPVLVGLISADRRKWHVGA